MDASVAVRDVVLRDGLQDETPVGTDAKLALFEALAAAGVADLELTSFVRPDRVPALADADGLAAATAHRAGSVTRWGLVLNQRGVQRALAAGIRHLQYVVSVSEAHHRENAGRSVADSMAELASLADAAHAEGAVMEVTLATAFGCPFTGPVPPADVLARVDEALDAGVDGISLADTIGTGVPGEVAALVADTVARAGDRPVGAHLHDTRGLALANALAAVDAGAQRLDGSAGGLGGCPFAPGATGNLALEDLVHALHETGHPTGVDLAALVDAGRLACELVGRPLTSHVGQAGPRFAST